MCNTRITALIGYPQVSTQNKDAAALITALKNFGFKLIIQEKFQVVSGTGRNCIVC